MTLLVGYSLKESPLLKLGNLSGTVKELETALTKS